MNVVGVEVKDWNKDDGTTVKVSHVRFDDGQDIPGYDLPPGIEVGKPLPAGWEIAQSKAGKPYIKVPKPGKGGFGGAPAAYRNTKDGQFYEEERKDRRTALMQACEISVDASVVLKLADTYYTWLRKTSGSAPPRVGTGDGGPTAAPSPSSSAPADEGRGGKAQNRASGEGATASPDQGQGKLGEGDPVSGSGVCAHLDNSPLKPDGSALPNGFLRCLGCGVVHKGG